MRLSDSLSEMYAILDRWKPRFLNPNFFRDGNQITVQAESSMWPETITQEDLARLESQRIYSFQRSDGSLFLLQYRFRTNEALEGCRLAFVKMQEHVESLPWLRIDLDRSSSRGIAHPTCHMQISGLHSARIALTTVPTPAQFVEAVQAWFYPSDFADSRLTDEGVYRDVALPREINRRTASFCEHFVIDDIAHVRFPTH